MRTTQGGKLAVAVAFGGVLSAAGIGVLVFAASLEPEATAFTVFLGIGLLAFGAVVGTAGFIEAITPIRVYVDGGELVIHRKRVIRLPTMRFVNVKQIANVAIETHTTTDDGATTRSHRVVLVLANGEHLAIGDYHYLSSEDEAKSLALELERMLAEA